MSAKEYKESIKHLIEITDNEFLLKHWKKQLEWDIKHQNEFGLSDEELSLVEEGILDYENGNVIPEEEFISKRK